MGQTDYASMPGRYVWTLGRQAADGRPAAATAEALTPPAEPDDLRRAPLLYYNQLALGLANSPYATGRSNCIGERVFHWVSFLELGADRWHPTDEELDGMAKAGATMLILHHEFMVQRGSNGDPPADYARFRNGAELRRCIAKATELGVRVGLYVRGVEDYGLDEAWWAELIEAGVSGFYIDWHEAHTVADAALGDRHFSADGSVAPARFVFDYTRRLRKMVGPGGFIITHLGSFNSGVLPNLGADGLTAGETNSERALFDSEEQAVFLGMMAGSVVMPWPEEAASFSEPEALAKMAAWGFYPHMIVGMDKPATGLFPRDPLAERHTTIQPYWQLLALIEDRRGLRVLNLPADARPVVACSHDAIRATAYLEADGDLTVLVANLSDRHASGAVEIDPSILPRGPVNRMLHRPVIDGNSALGSSLETRDLGDGKGPINLELQPWAIAAITIESATAP